MRMTITIRKFFWTFEILIDSSQFFCQQVVKHIFRANITFMLLLQVEIQKGLSNGRRGLSFTACLEHCLRSLFSFVSIHIQDLNIIYINTVYNKEKSKKFERNWTENKEIIWILKSCNQLYV